ncbi:uncharacterized protein HKW66_Vig0218580 [Vigna angularis]|uniref:Pentacotripeptide-repeat region of PRORP domain-containing protein n=1 Tax=Phaseolus angularis TaxID=3914 RepID=A0A8T0JGN5_PHAAN|nr:uncharacterized protein HKW66_Vig0218580 [Vigna angularis]
MAHWTKINIKNLANWEWITYGTRSKKITQSPIPQELKSVNEPDTRSQEENAKLIDFNGLEGDIPSLHHDYQYTTAFVIFQTFYHGVVRLSLKCTSLELDQTVNLEQMNFILYRFAYFLLSQTYEFYSKATYFSLALAPKYFQEIIIVLFLEEISEIMSSSTSSSFINKIIFAFAKCGQKDKSLVIFDHLRRQRYGPDLVTYNIVLDILGHMGRVDEMLNVFSSIKDTGLIPDTVSYNTLMNGLRKVGRFDMCFVYYKEMTDNGIEPDLLTYTVLIEIFGRSGSVEESLKYFKEMKKKGILPSVFIYRSLIQNLNKTGKVELAKELLEELNSSSTRLAGPEDFKRKTRQRNTLKF